MNYLKVIASFLKKEFKQLLRSREMLIVLFVLPAVQLLVMGFAVTNEVKNVQLSIIDYDHSPLSRKLVASFSSTDRFRLVPVAENTQPEDLLLYWKSKVVVVIPPDFGKNIQLFHKTTLQVISDGIDGNTAAIANAYVNGCLVDFYGKWLGKSDLRYLTALQKQNSFDVDYRMSFNPDLQSKMNIVPGIVAVLVTITSMLLSAMSLVKEKELGTMEQLMVTPAKKAQILAGKLIPYLLITLVQIHFSILLTWLIFGIGIQGSFSVLLLFTMCYLFTTLGSGIFISTIVSSQQQAMFFSWFIMVVSILLSGFFVPVQNMPNGIRSISYFIPLRHYITIMREIVVKGSGLSQLTNELFILLGSGVLIFGLSILSFRKRV